MSTLKSSTLSSVPQSYLIVSVNGLQYALAAHHVLEIFALPALTLIPAAPRDIVGVLNLRSQLLAVMHLGVRLGMATAQCRVQDSVVVIGQGDSRMGVVVDTVQEVQTLESSWITTEIPYGRPELVKPEWLGGVANVFDAWVMLLDVPRLIASMAFTPPSAIEIEAITAMALRLAPEGADPKIWDQINASEIPASHDSAEFYDRWFLQITDAEKAILAERAEQLRQPLEDGTSDALIPLAIVRLNQEYFGFDLDQVRDFAPVQGVTAIPCCPSHIVGNVNLRGEIVTLIDLRQVLKLTEAKHPVRDVMVVTVDDIVVGIPVDEVVDVLYLPPDQLMGGAMTSGVQTYARGTAVYGERLLSVMDLPKLITSGVLTVHDKN